MAVCPSSQETVCPSSQVLVAAMSSVKQEIPASAPPIKALPATGNLFGYLTFEYVTFGYLDSFLFFGWDSMGSLSTLSNSCQLRQRMTLTSPSRKCWWCEWKRHLGLLIHGEKHIVSQKYPKIIGTPHFIELLVQPSPWYPADHGYREYGAVALQQVWYFWWACCFPGGVWDKKTLIKVFFSSTNC